MNNKNKKKEEKSSQEEAFQNETVAQQNESVNEEFAEETKNQKENDPQEEDQITNEVEEIQKALEDMKDKYLRLSAEFDNFRKRTMKEKAELILNGGEKTIVSVLPILDDMERALSTMEKAEDVVAVKEGVDLIYQKFLKVLAQNGVKPIETDGKALDTDYHEAIALVPSPSEEKKGKIIDCVQKGYQLNDKVIRHAKVVVGN